MTTNEAKTITVADFIEQLHYLSIERLNDLVPKVIDASKNANNSAGRAKYRWLCECIRDNTEIYRKTLQKLQRYGVKNAIKGDQGTVELLRGIGISC